MALLFLWLPFVSFFISSLLGRRIGVTGSHLLSVFLISSSVIALFVVVYEYLSTGDQQTNFLEYITTGLLSNYWSVKIDGLVLSLLLPVLLISTLVHLYSVSYISGDPHQQRFFSYLSLFTGSIVLLVTGNSILQLFVGWELIGISSYLLIGFWSTKLEASQSALQAFILNRLGDVALSISLYLFYLTYATTNYDSAIALAVESKFYGGLVVLFLLAAIAKSAQLGFNTWLPNAIIGPTPVSALIHAATLVTAGAFLLIRVSPLLEENFLLIGLIGAITALFAGTVGLVQNDLKQIIAFSTCSQIGYLFLAIGLGEFSTALFHLVNHAIFKALLFLSAGVVIHAIQDNQDLRRIGGLLAYLPIAFVCLLAGSLSLIALPYLTGFYSKEVILELAYVNYTVQGFYLYVLGLTAAALTGFYSFRLISLAFLQVPNSRVSTYSTVHFPDLILILPLVFLFVLSIVLGYLLKDIYLGLGSIFLSSSLLTTPTIIEAEFSITTIEKLLPLVVTILGASLGLFLPSTCFPIRLYSFLSLKWALDDVINAMGYQLLSFGLTTSKLLDRGLFETVGPFGISYLLTSITGSIFRSYTVASYALVMVLSIIIFIFPLKERFP